MREAWQVRRRSEITEQDAHCQVSPGCSACRAQGKEAKTGVPECPKEIEEMNTYAQTVSKLLMRRPYISILMHKHSVFMKLETKFRN